MPTVLTSLDGGTHVGEMIQFQANGRTAPGYLAMPDEGRGPGLIVIQEYWGLVDHIKDVADRFAHVGFVTLAPDLYHGETTSSPDAAGKLMMALNIGEAAKDMRGAADHLLAMDEVTSEKVGILGFCMGGQLALFAGCEYPDRIGAVVDFYGVHPNVSPRLEQLEAPVLAHFAARDSFVTPAVARDLVDRLRAAGKSVEAHVYDADHAFVNDTRPQVYSPDDARLAWSRTVDFLTEALGSGQG